MFRKYFAKRNQPKKEKIAWRSHEVTRIEAFSDAVFAFSVSLLVISLEVPKSSKELMESIIGFIPFAFCFGIIFWIWRCQYKFFRRYGLHDKRTLALNGILLFFVLCFVYPLKFLFSTMFLPAIYTIRNGDYALMVMLYNGGFVIIGILFALMYLNASHKKHEINLTAMERFETISYAWVFIIPAMASILAIIIAWFERNNGKDHISVCYWAYALLGIAMPLFAKKREKSFKRNFGNTPATEPHHGTEG